MSTGSRLWCFTHNTSPDNCAVTAPSTLVNQKQTTPKRPSQGVAAGKGNKKTRATQTQSDQSEGIHTYGGNPMCAHFNYTSLRFYSIWPVAKRSPKRDKMPTFCEHQATTNKNQNAGWGKGRKPTMARGRGSWTRRWHFGPPTSLLLSRRRTWKHRTRSSSPEGR